jgi:hypothetical protein
MSIKAESVCLCPDDANSVLAWVEHLKENQELLGFKASNQEPPLGLGLESDLFYIMIQTP